MIQRVAAALFGLRIIMYQFDYLKMNFDFVGFSSIKRNIVFTNISNFSQFFYADMIKTDCQHQVAEVSLCICLVSWTAQVGNIGFREIYLLLNRNLAKSTQTLCSDYLGMQNRLFMEACWTYYRKSRCQIFFCIPNYTKVVFGFWDIKIVLFCHFLKQGDSHGTALYIYTEGKQLKI